jgi:sugar lactone lactonase YvrE
VVADASGRVYVSDLVTNRIYRHAGGETTVWLDSPELANPNGLAIRGDTLFVACWGVMDPADFSTRVPGHVKTVSLRTQAIADYGSDTPIGNLDGIEPMPDGSVLVTDWMAGGLMRVSPAGEVIRIDALAPGSADLGLSADGRTVFIPMMKDGVVRAFMLEP